MIEYTYYLIPLTNIPQVFNIVLAGVTYIMTCRWNDADEAGWQIGLADQVTGNEIVNNIPIITGADLLSGLTYLGIGGSLYAYTAGDVLAPPTLDNLGVDANLYFVTPGVN